MSGVSFLAASFFGNTDWRSVADVARPLEYPIVVFEAAVAAAWRIEEGFVGAGVGFGREVRDVLKRGFAGGLLGFDVGFGRGTACLGWDRAAAADLDLMVEGPVVEAGFFVLGCDSAAIAVIVFWYCSSAAFLASMV